MHLEYNLENAHQYWDRESDKYNDEPDPSLKDSFVR
jgi:hypothetical protein